MRKKILIPIFLIFAMMFSIIGVYSASPGIVTLTLPATDDAITGTYIFTGTSGNSGSGANFSISTDSGATFSIFCNNATVGLTTYTCSNSTALVSSDLANVQINFTVYNNTGGINQDSDTNNGVDIDNTDPSAVFVVEKEFADIGGSLFVDCSGSNDAVDTDLTHLLTLTKPDTTTSTATTSTNTFTGRDDFPSPGEYTVQCTVTDDVSKTSSVSHTILVNRESEAGVDTEISSTVISKGKSNLLWLGLGLFIVILGVLALILYLNKK